MKTFDMGKFLLFGFFSIAISTPVFCLTSNFLAYFSYRDNIIRVLDPKSHQLIDSLSFTADGDPKIYRGGPSGNLYYTKGGDLYRLSVENGHLKNMLVLGMPWWNFQKQGDYLPDLYIKEEANSGIFTITDLLTGKELKRIKTAPHPKVDYYMLNWISERYLAVESGETGSNLTISILDIQQEAFVKKLVLGKWSWDATYLITPDTHWLFVNEPDRPAVRFNLNASKPEPETFLQKGDGVIQVMDSARIIVSGIRDNALHRMIFDLYLNSFTADLQAEYFDFPYSSENFVCGEAGLWWARYAMLNPNKLDTGTPVRTLIRNINPDGAGNLNIMDSFFINDNIGNIYALRNCLSAGRDQPVDSLPPVRLVLQGHDNISKIQYTYDGLYFVTTSVFGNISVWDAKTFFQLNSISNKCANQVLSIDRNHNFICDECGDIYDFYSGKLLESLSYPHIQYTDADDHWCLSLLGDVGEAHFDFLHDDDGQAIGSLRVAGANSFFVTDFGKTFIYATDTGAIAVYSIDSKSSKFFRPAIPGSGNKNGYYKLYKTNARNILICVYMDFSGKGSYAAAFNFRTGQKLKWAGEGIVSSFYTPPVISNDGTLFASTLEEAVKGADTLYGVYGIPMINVKYYCDLRDFSSGKVIDKVEIVSGFHSDLPQENCLAISPDARYIIASLNDKAGVFAVKSGTPVRNLTNRQVPSFDNCLYDPKEDAITLKFGLNRCRLRFSPPDATEFFRYDIDSQDKYMRFIFPESELCAVVFHDVEKDFNFKYRLFDYHNQPLSDTLNHNNEFLTLAAISPGNDKLALYFFKGGQQYELCIYNLAEKKWEASVLTGIAMEIKFTADGNRLLLAKQNSYWMYDVKKLQFIDSVGNIFYLSANTIHPPTDQLIYADIPGNIRYIDLKDFHIAKTFSVLSNSSVGITADNKYLLVLNEGNISLRNIEDFKEVRQFPVAAPPLGPAQLFTTRKNNFLVIKEFNRISIYNFQTGKLLLSLLPVSDRKILLLDHSHGDSYYFDPQKASTEIGFAFNNHAYPFDQFDIKYNRPDLVMKSLNIPDSIILPYHLAYEKRLKKLGLTESEIDSTKLVLPEIKLLNEPPPLSETGVLNLSVKAISTQSGLNKINIYDNGVPLFGLKGLPMDGNNTDSIVRSISVQLNKGINKMELSCQNRKGLESYKESFIVTYAPKVNLPEPRTYFVGIGVSHYKDSVYNLTYASKDIRDLASTLSTSLKNVEVDTFIDQVATRSNILKIRDKLMHTRIEDKVIFSISGHGLLNDSLDFYYGTYDIDFKYPERRGLLYNDIENLLDSIPARRKLLLVDACNSGEVDKDAEPTLAQAPNKRAELPEHVVTRGFSFSKQGGKLGLQNSFELMKNLFTDLTRSNGAVVISAATGEQYAYESPKWNNGVFTYCVRQALMQKANITVSQLKDKVSNEVQLLTNNKQSPTSRKENVEWDWAIK